MLILGGPRQRIDALTFSPGGGLLLAPRPDQTGASCWALAEGRTKPDVWEQDVEVRSVAFTPDGKWVLVAGRRMFLRRVGTGERVEVTFPAPYAEWATAAFAPGGRRFVAALGEYFADPPSRLVCRAVTDPAADVWSVGVDRRLQSEAMFLPGGRRFVVVEGWNGDTGSEHGPAFVTRDARTGAAVSEIREKGKGYTAVVQSPDLRFVAGRYENRITVWRTEDFRTPAGVVRNDTRKDFTGVAFHPSGRFLAATSNDATVKLVATDSRQITRTLTWGIGRLRSVAFSPDGLRAAAGSDTGKVVVWDVDE
jgi:WD40 repeat protein